MRRFVPLLLIVLAACQASTATPAPSTTTSAPEAVESTSTDEPTASRTPRPTQTPRPTALPPLSPSLPTTNTYPRLMPEGAQQILGIGALAVTSVSPDGSLIAVTTSLGLIMLDAVTYQEVWSMPGPAIHTIYWSPDGTRIAFAEGERVRVLDAATGSILTEMWLPGVTEGIGYAFVDSISWPASGTALALSGSTSMVWDYAADTVLFRIDDPETHNTLFAWLPDDRHVVSTVAVDVDEAITTVWDVASGQPVFSIEGDFPTWNPDGSLMIVRLQNNDLVVVDTASGGVLWRLDAGMIISPDWTRIAVPISEHTLAIQPFGREAPTTTLLTLTPVEYESIEWSPDSSQLAVIGSNDVTLWDTQTGHRICAAGNVRLNVATLDEEPIYVNWFPDRGLFTTSISGEPAVSLWHSATCQRLSLIPTEQGHYGYIQQLPNPAAFLVTRRSVAVWDVGTQQSIFSLVGSGSDHRELYWSEDSMQVIAVNNHPSGEETAVVWSIETGMALSTIPAPPRDTSSEHRYVSPDGSMAIRINDMYYYEVYDIATSQTLIVLEEAELLESDPTGRWAWSPDGSSLVGNMASGLYIYDAESWRLLDARHDLRYGYGVAFSPDGQWLAVNVGGAVVIYPAP